MFFKLAARNVRRSIKDYMVYFITLMLSVCIFYMFNSIDSQLVMLQIVESDAAADFGQIIGVISGFISVVLAFLVVYANGYIIRRRQKEIGIYLLLGFSNRKTAGMLVLETFLIGLLALVCGLGVGYLASQAMSVLTANLFGVVIRNYHFVFSMDALIKTCIYFGIIFVVVMLFNAVNISRQTLSKLLSAGVTNETFRVHRRGIAIVLIAAGILLIAGSYWMVLGLGIGTFIVVFAPALAVNFVGTLLLFYGLSGIMLTSRKKVQTRKLRGLKIFSERQLLSRVNTNSVSMTFICTMIFLTLVIVSSISSLNAVLNREFATLAPYDISLTAYDEENPPQVGVIEERLQANGIEMSMFSGSTEYLLFQTGAKLGQIAAPDKSFDSDAADNFVETQLTAITVSDFNRLSEIQGREPITLPNESSYGLVSASDMVTDMITAESGGSPLNVGSYELVYSGLPPEKMGLRTTSFSTSEVFLIVPDAAAVDLPVYIDTFVADYSGDTDVSDQIIRAHPQLDNGYEAESDRQGPLFRIAIGSEVRFSHQMTTASLVFVGLYIGMIFLVAGAAILALQQLSGASDDRPRYVLLSKLGASRGMIDKALLQQTAVYFFLPLLIGAIHSVFGITYMNQAIGVLGYGDILTGAITAALFIIAIYGVYFAATYLGCRSIIRAKAARQE